VSPMSPGWTPEKYGAPVDIRTPDPLLRRNFGLFCTRWYAVGSG
jgi:hypothetical protein